MDQKLVAWARSVKSRLRHRPHPVPPLWLFTDPVQMPDLPSVVRRLPPSLCGVVFRHDAMPGRAGLARRIEQICRSRRLVLVIAGRPIPGVKVGRHLRGGWGPPSRRFSTSSAHSPADLVRARRRRVNAIFLSPVFPTRSHPGAPCLGPIRWAAMTRTTRQTPILALGGIDGRTVQALPRTTSGVGAIGAFGPHSTPGGGLDLTGVSRLPQCFAIAMGGPV